MLCILSFFINAPVDKLLVGTLHERTTLAFVLGLQPELALLVVKMLVAFSTLHLSPKKDAHDRAD